ncbi:Sulfate transporter 1.3 [Sesamum angolense]|uniref:Sulfate transporter 1.3 n=1 Tax=Sesamum angolense TaxID=2727404 RepID=A0AAE1WYQ5_9LAMI|nr:Sulfate transporter 1.3 [Sesamum angolense]
MTGSRVADESDIASAASSRRHQASLFKEFKFTFKETFFHDDPLRRFKDQPRFPILEWGRRYELSMFKGDLIAGITIASLCIPQDIGYVKLANTDPQFGLYSSFIPPLIMPSWAAQEILSSAQ